MRTITLSYTKTVHQNAVTYFEKAKKAQKKLDGLAVALTHSQKKLIKAIEQKDEYLKKLDDEQEEREKQETEWFEQFRWFFTSTNHLAIGGRDAQTNEQLIKKHAQKGDIVFHTDMAGSPFFILKTQNTQVSPIIFEEVAQLTASYSKAWQEGFSSLAVFYVKPDQVTKQANSGESLKKGSFVIRGKTTYIQPKLEVCIGFDEKRQKIICGTKRSIKQHTNKSVTIVQGNRKASDIAREIKERLKKGLLDDIIKMLPSGGCRIAK